MNVTLYAIAKNEEKNIEKFIENSKKFSHTVVVDTGSTDNTAQLLRDAGIEVHEHPQKRKEFDFALARNTALSYVKTDWAFSLDFNEDVDGLFFDGLEYVANDATCLKHLRYDDNGEGEPKQSNEVHVRFHRTKNYEWRNAVHEIPHFVPTEEFPSEIEVQTNSKITKKVNKSVDKELFYISICEREYQKDPTNSYYTWFIFNHYFTLQNAEKALEFGQEFLNNTKAYFNEFRIECFIKCSRILLQSGNLQLGSNYAFHALSEAMNMGEQYMGMAFSHLLQVGININNPDIIVFASAFSEQTRHLPQRLDAIKYLYENR